MADQFNVLVICGSLRKGSYNAALARALPRLAPPEIKFVTAPSFGTLPLYNADIQEVLRFSRSRRRIWRRPFALLTVFCSLRRNTTGRCRAV